MSFLYSVTWESLYETDFISFLHVGRIHGEGQFSLGFSLGKVLCFKYSFVRLHQVLAVARGFFDL